MFVSQKMVIAKKTAKKVVFDQEIEYEESLLQDIDTKRIDLDLCWMKKVQNNV